MATKIPYDEIKKSMEAAESDTTPILIPGEETTVAGDANKTEINCHDFEITFRIPQEMEDGSVKQIKKTKEYKNVYITPRMDAQVVKLITAVMPYFKKPNEDGTVGEYTEEEQKHIMKAFSGEILDIMYETVGTVLKIDPVIREHMMENSVMAAALKIIQQFPEIINEGDTFFG